MKKSNRPLLITIICILGFIGTSIGILTPIIKYLPPEILIESGVTFTTSFLIITSLISMALLYSFIQIWKMKKLGIYLYLGFTIINYIYGYQQGLVTYKNLIIPVIFITTFYYYFKKFK